jgi:hypothetical protein
VNWHETDMINFIKQTVDSFLHYGGAIGEMIINEANTEIASLRNGDVKNIRFKKVDEAELLLVQTNISRAIPFRNQNLIFYSGYQYMNGCPYGYPLFYAVPIVAQIFSHILNAIKNQLIRISDPIFFIAFETGKDAKIQDAKDSMDSLKSNFSYVMGKKMMGKSGDIFSVSPPDSKYFFKAIGGDIEVFDLSIPSKILLEQFSMASTLPPFLVNLDFSSKYQITTWQYDALDGTVANLHANVEPIIKKILNRKSAYLSRAGIPIEIVWDDLTLQDKETAAKIRKMDSESDKLDAETRIMLMESLAIDQDDVTEWATEKGYKIESSARNVNDLFDEIYENNLKQDFKESSINRIRGLISELSENEGNGHISNVNVGIASEHS